ncbi:unnamed protein product, partial [Allacma fusca]
MLISLSGGRVWSSGQQSYE